MSLLNLKNYEIEKDDYQNSLDSNNESLVKDLSIVLDSLLVDILELWIDDLNFLLFKYLFLYFYFYLNFMAFLSLTIRVCLLS